MSALSSWSRSRVLVIATSPGSACATGYRACHDAGCFTRIEGAFVSGERPQGRHWTDRATAHGIAKSVSLEPDSFDESTVRFGILLRAFELVAQRLHRIQTCAKVWHVELVH